MLRTDIKLGNPWAEEFSLAVKAATEAGQLIATRFIDDAGINHARDRDIKTEADLAAEKLILNHLASTKHPVIAEESAGTEEYRDSVRWLIDPLDGTMNLSRQFPMFAVSIALWDGMQPILGVIYDIERSKTYAGLVGVGSWCDEGTMTVSRTNEIGQAILATGFPTFRDYGTESLQSFIQKIQAFKKVRMIGSAAMSLAMVGSGVFDAYFEEEIMLWDIAAGAALVIAAGGCFEVESGKRPNSVIAKAWNGNFSSPEFLR